MTVLNNCNRNNLPDEVQSQLAVIDQSQWYILIILAAIVLSYYSVNLQKKQLICSATDPEISKCLPSTLPIQAVSSIMVIVALIFFFHLSGETLCNTPCNTKERCRSGLNHLSSTLVLVAALVRFGLLTTAPAQNSQANVIQNETQLDIDVEPAV